MSDLWNRTATIQIGTRKYSIDDLYFEFTVPFEDSETLQESTFKINNLSETTRKEIKRGHVVILNAGYEDDVGVIFIGQVSACSHQHSGTEWVTNITAVAAMDEWLNKKVNKTYNVNITAEDIVSDLLNMFGLEVGEFELETNKKYPRGRVCSGKVKDVLIDIVVNDCKSRFLIKDNNIIINNPNKGRCSRYNNNGGKSCTPHFIYEIDVCAFVLNDIRQHAQLAANEREQLASRLLSSMKKAQSGETHAIRSKIKEAENRLTVIASTLKSLYEDKCAGKLPEDVFLNLMGDFTKEKAAIEERLPQLRRELDGIQETTGEINDWLSLIISYTELETLERDTVTGLIENITVSERTKQWGRNTQEIEIEYRFIKNLLTNDKEDIG